MAQREGVFMKEHKSPEMLEVPDEASLFHETPIFAVTSNDELSDSASHDCLNRLSYRSRICEFTILGLRV